MSSELTAYRVVPPDHARLLRWSWECVICNATGWDQRGKENAERNAKRHQASAHPEGQL